MKQLGCWGRVSQIQQYQNFRASSRPKRAPHDTSDRNTCTACLHNKIRVIRTHLSFLCRSHILAPTGLVEGRKERRFSWHPSPPRRSGSPAGISTKREQNTSTIRTPPKNDSLTRNRPPTDVLGSHHKKKCLHAS